MELSEAPVMEEVKRGFKKTEVGITPEDWEVKKVLEFASMRTGPFGSALHKSDYMTGGVPVINPMHIVDGRLIPSPTMSVTEQAATQLAPFRLKPGDIVMGRRGDMGRCAVVEKNQEGWLCGTGSLIIRCAERANPAFMQRVLSSPRITSAMTEASVGSTMVNLNQGTMGSLRVQFPSLPEQRAIATALSDVDALLNSLDALIAKKKAIKQGAMQQLLTGKQRLPGFKGEWDVKTMRQLGNVYGGLSGKSKADFGSGNARYIPFMNIMQGPVIDTTFLDSVRVGSTEAQNKALKGDLFFNGSSETPEEVGMCSMLREDITDLYLNSFSFGFRLNKELKADGTFLSYWFRSPAGRKAIYSSAQGATRYNLAKSNFLRLEVPYPKPEEQTAIATVLSDMDAELAALEARRAKTALLKQGMMQELLTGRTRLV